MPLSKLMLVAIIAALGAAGCSRESADAPKAESAPAVAKAKPTKEDWDNALKASYTLEDSKDQGDGITEYRAAFEVGKEKPLYARVKRDAFRKLRHWRTTGHAAQSLAEFTYKYLKKDRGSGVFAYAYIALSDYSTPTFFIHPKRLYERSGMITLNRIGILVDGELALDKEIPIDSLKLDGDELARVEEAHIVLSAEDIEQLRRVKPEASIAIRLTGKRAYTNADQPTIKTIVQNIQETITVYDKLNAALKDKAIDD